MNKKKKVIRQNNGVLLVSAVLSTIAALPVLFFVNFWLNWNVHYRDASSMHFSFLVFLVIAVIAVPVSLWAVLISRRDQKNIR